MRAFRDTAVETVMGVVGAVFGVLSIVTFALVAGGTALIGMLAFVLSPLRALLDRFRGADGRA